MKARWQIFAAVVSLVSLGAMFGFNATIHAHHSPSAFDSAHPVTATGTVKSFVWSNPHTWLYLLVPNEQGTLDEWEIEGPSVGTLVRQGWKSTSIKPGEKLHVLMARRVDGGHGGTFMQVTRDNGEVLNTGRL